MFVHYRPLAVTVTVVHRSLVCQCQRPQWSPWALPVGLVTSPVGTSHESGPGPQASAGYEFAGQGRDLQALLSPMPPRAGGARAGGARAAFYVTESSAAGTSGYRD